MNQQKKKSKAVMKILFVFLAILVLALIGAIVYFYLTGEILQTEEEETITCGCYYIDPQVTSTCGDTKRAFKFNTTKGTLQDCSASCPVSDLSTNMLYSTTAQESYLSCPTRNIPSTRCNSMQITTEEGLIVTGKVPPGESVKVTATFDSPDYENHQFLINNAPTEPDEVNGNAISKTISELGEESTLQISAQAVDSRGDTVSSIICNRLIEITTTAKAGVSELVLDTYTEGTTTKVRSAVISAGGLKETDTSVKFSFKEDSLTMTEGFEIDPSRGRITIEQEDLYNSSNFSGSDSFSLLDNYQGDIEITAEVIQDSNSLGTAIANITLLEDEEVEDPGKDTEEPDTEEPDTEEPDTEEPVNEDEITASSFSVSKATSQSCVERVSPNNSTTFTITVKNNSETSDTIESIKDKLPLGFTYVPSSSTLNGDAISDSVFVTTTEVGDSQEIVWEPQDSWSISSNSTLTITFDATAGSQALSGDNLNEVIVTPSEIPEDPSTLRTSVNLTVAQDCEDIDTSTPQTGLFDTTLGRIAFGIGIILIGIIIHNTSQGNRLAHMIINSGPYRDAEMTSYRFFNPKKYFEEKILERRERKR
jgi:uncharacterized repeat protein (TIGR01451 family)